MVEVQENLNLYNLNNLEIKSVVIESQVLAGNPLGDSTRRVNPVLLPKCGEKDLPVIFVLAGFTGNGGKYFNQKSYEQSAIDVLIEAISAGEAPRALYVFVDAWTFWGGSQFINSTGCGKYEDYLITELVEAIKTNFPVSTDPSMWAVTGGSSGGYGGLHLGSKYPEIFGNIGAIAPDSFFKMSLLPEIYTAWPRLMRWGGVSGVRQAIDDGKILGRRDSHTILNAIGMGLCYAGTKDGEIEWPINNDGELIDEVWQQWLKHDPIVFLPTREKSLLQLNAIYLDVGKSDQFQLQFGSRQINNELERVGASVKYSEFKGSHFDIGDRRIYLWKWLNDIFTK